MLAVYRTFLLFLFGISFAELLPPRREVSLRGRLNRRHWGGLGLSIAHAGRRIGAMVVVHAVGHGGGRLRAARLFSGTDGRRPEAQRVVGASRDGER
jgi:hypothetical protein